MEGTLALRQPWAFRKVKRDRVIPDQQVAGSDAGSGAELPFTLDRSSGASDSGSGGDGSSLDSGGEGGYWTPAFMARTVTGALNLTSNAAVAAEADSGAGTVGDPYVIYNRSFDALGANVIAIRLYGISVSVRVLACDFRDVAEGVFAGSCTGKLEIGWCRYKNITGPHERVGLNRGNFSQFYLCNGGGRIYNNKGREGDTEDIVSLVSSSGFTVEDNHFEGTNWTSGSGSGIALGDVGGNNNIAQRNKLKNPGQVGIFIAGGTGSTIDDNIIYKPQGSNGGSGDVGVYIWQNPPSNPSGCSGHTFTNNRVLWYKADGSQNPYWNGGNCGTIDTDPANNLNDSSLVTEPLTVTL